MDPGSVTALLCVLDLPAQLFSIEGFRFLNSKITSKRNLSR
jgi:hypothetical protein